MNCSNMSEAGETRTYKISGMYKKSVWEREVCKNQLSNGKIVTYHISTCFRWGSFEIELSDEDKVAILANDEVIELNDYAVSDPEMWDGVAREEEIEDEDSYTPDELDEIKRLLFYSKEDDELRDEDDGVSTDMMEENGWDLDDTEYSICGGCKLSDF